MRAFANIIKLNKRNLSRGALAGGFTKQGLQHYASHFWEEDVCAPYTDLFSKNISFECCEWLDNHHDPSSELATSLFGSTRFVPERLLMTPFCEQTELPAFKANDQYLVWEVTMKAPHEIICSFEVIGMKGLTMMGFDPRTRRVFLGSCIDNQSSQRTGFTSMVPLHCSYSQYLLQGLTETLESKTVR